MQTLMVIVKGNGVNRLARALIDTGSQRSYLLTSTIAEMKYKKTGEEVIRHGLFGGLQSKEKYHKKYEIRLSATTGNYNCSFAVLDEPVICGRIPRAKSGPWVQELKKRNVKLADFGQDCPQIEILIGIDVAAKLFTGQRYQLNSGLVAEETRLGWIISGKVPEVEKNESSALTVTSLLMREVDISDLWRLDVIGINGPIETKNNEELQKEAMEHFQKTVSRNSDGRYNVKLPWVEGHPPLPTNRVLAEKRLISMTKKLVTQNKMEEYDKVFKDWLSQGIIEEVLPGENEAGHYLAHRAVYKENSTTPTRPVFDASAREVNSPALNDCLAKGENLMELIVNVILRFRMGKIGVVADICKAFLQICVDDRDCNYLKFLWWEDYEKKIVKVFRHRRVVFGVSSSPFLLGATIAHHLARAPQHFKETAVKLLRSFYVDNCVTSVNSEEELTKFILESQDLMKSALFDLRGWEHTHLNMDEENCENAGTGVLGMNWEKNQDTLSIDMKQFTMLDDCVITKRKMLSVAHQVFDPIGVSCPTTLIPKMLLQKTWELKGGWDSELPEEITEKFKKWAKQLPFICEVKIPRWIFTEIRPRDKWSLHMFCDASQDAYAACVFIRSENDNDVTVQLIQAKARVCPLKKMTIPRKELLSCTIGARLVDTVKKILDVSEISTYCWSDSTTALCWIDRRDQWGTFVWNRVQEIRSLTPPENWRHVPGILNPADLPSRGCTVKQLIESRWWEGPAWLKNPREEWPNSNPECNEEEVNSERKKTIVSNLVRCASKPQWYVRKFFNYFSTVKLLAWINRFIKNVRCGEEDRCYGRLSAQEIEEAEKKIIRIIQRESFSSTKDERLKSLSVYEDDEGLYRVNTKIMRREDEINFKSPYVLPSDHVLVKMMIVEKHNQLCHSGIQVMLSNLREKFWILKGRKALQNFIRSCVICKRFQSKGLTTPAVPLPKDRVKNASVFEVVGVDLAGPLYLKGKVKAWIVLFTCAVYRAIHLELVTSLSTEAFIQSLRRFAARRGRPSIVYSDNGTNFVGTQNAFKNINWKLVEEYALVQRIDWRFNPPSAAWWGGWWERMVRMVKELLRRVLGRASLSYEEMSTIIVHCEAVINSRPLTYVSENATDMQPLTPASFLHENRMAGVPEADALDADGLNRRNKYQQKLRDDLRQRFRKEYLGQLLQRAESKKTHDEVFINDVVLVGSDNSKRLDWPIARVMEKIPGKDGKVRVVRLRTTNGEILRPVQRIYPLEVSNQEEGLIVSQHKVTQPVKNKVPEKAVEKEKIVEEEITTRSVRVIKKPLRY